MASAKEIRQRRNRIRKTIADNPRITNEELAEKEQVSEKTIERDIEAIKDEEYQDPDIGRYIMRLRRQMEEMESQYQEEYQTAESSSNRLGALNGRVRLKKVETKTLQRLGVLPEEPLRIRQENENNDLRDALDEVRDEIAEAEEEE